MKNSREMIVHFLSLFGSGATLLCCALPAALSLVAGGAAVGALISFFPWLVPISRHHDAVFLIAGILLFADGIFVLRPKGRLACSVTGGRGCETAGRVSKWIFRTSIVLYGVGAFFAYAYVPLARSLGLD